MPRSSFRDIGPWPLIDFVFGVRSRAQSAVFAGLFIGLSVTLPVLAQTDGNIPLNTQSGVTAPPINVPELTTGDDISPNTSDQREDVPINVPELFAGPSSIPKDMTINIPDLIIVGVPDPIDVAIDVPHLVIVGVPEPVDITIDVPDLTIVGVPEEQPDDPLSRELTVATGETTQDQPETPTTIGTAPDLQAVAQWCVGDFDAHIGRGVGTAVGFAMPFGDYLMSDGQVTSRDCRNTLVFKVQGQTVILNQTDTPRRYSGSIDFGDGAARTLVLHCDEDLNLRGQLIAADQNLRIERPVWLLRKPQSPADIADCRAVPND